jgi:hypothetical protein
MVDRCPIRGPHRKQGRRWTKTCAPPRRTPQPCTSFHFTSIPLLHNSFSGQSDLLRGREPSSAQSGRRLKGFFERLVVVESTDSNANAPAALPTGARRIRAELQRNLLVLRAVKVPTSHRIISSDTFANAARARCINPRGVARMGCDDRAVMVGGVIPQNELGIGDSC